MNEIKKYKVESYCRTCQEYEQDEYYDTIEEVRELIDNCDGMPLDFKIIDTNSGEEIDPNKNTQ